MADSIKDKHSDDDINKEEGEITDDDENEEQRVEIATSRRGQRERYESTYSSKSRRGHRVSDRGTFSSSSNDSPVPRSRDYHGPRTRPFLDSARAGSPSSCSYNSTESPLAYMYGIGSRRGNDYRDYHSQRGRQYDQLSQNTSLHLPNSARCILFL